MWVYPVLLPAISNREDFNLSVSIFDDDTGEAVNLHGTTGHGTFSSWTVTDGSIITSSVTSITIPPLPIGNELSALSLTVAPSLGILAGDPVLIEDVSSANTMTGTVVSYAAQTGALVCQIGMTFQFEIRRTGPHECGSGYVPWLDVGVPSDISPLLTASLGNGITITDTGYMQITIREAYVRRLRLATYQAALTAFDGVNTRQVFVASLPVQSGGVSL